VIETLDREHSASKKRGLAAALGAAFFFGISTPFSKLILGAVSPPMLAGLLYLGSFAGLTLASLFRRASPPMRTREAALRGRDYIYLAGSILAGGIAAPFFLLYGLKAAEASTASLLLNLEGTLTALVAYLFFREHVGRWTWASAAVMLTASSILSYAPGTAGWQVRHGSMLVLAAALMWALDNNLTRELSHRDPYMISRLKGLAAGAANVIIAFAVGAALPPSVPLAGSLVLGALSYGAALVLFIYALRHLGASRTGAYFGAAPFVGVAVSMILLGEGLTMRIISASALMLAGLWLILKEYHEHEHTHEELRHDHAHIHDEHHDHAHDGDTAGPHSHMHTHAGLTHSHAHVPDIHHLHRH
jgi:drug/metabolite transporter (DMT)-like permease